MQYASFSSSRLRASLVYSLIGRPVVLRVQSVGRQRHLRPRIVHFRFLLFVASVTSVTTTMSVTVVTSVRWMSIIRNVTHDGMIRLYILFFIPKHTKLLWDVYFAFNKTIERNNSNNSEVLLWVWSIIIRFKCNGIIVSQLLFAKVNPYQLC